MRDGKIERMTPVHDSLRTLTLIVYVLQACSFFAYVPAIVAIIINYVKRSEAQGTRWQGHFDWQIRTFWLALVGYIISALLVWLFGLGILTGFLVWVWSLYRVIRGFLAFQDGKSSP